MLSHEKEPYVYNIPIRDTAALMDAIRNALANPLPGPWIPPQMTKQAFFDRLDNGLISRDWEGLWHQRRAQFNV
jgi:hypothetical protein